MRYPQVLEELGFSQKETSVYMSLLGLDTATAAELAKKADINRTSCYDILLSLIKRGVISKIVKKGKTYFQAGDPRKLINYLDHEKEEIYNKIKKKKKMVSDIIPELVSVLKPGQTKTRVQFYEGVKGMREAYEDTLTSKGEILAYANVSTMHEGLPNFFPEYYSRRAKAGINIKAIMPDNEQSADRAKKDKEEKRQSILLVNKLLTFTPEVNIYNDKVLIASWIEKMAVIIESKEFADLQRLIYTQLWEALKKDSKNIVSA